MNKIIEIPEGYEARIEGNKVVLEPKGREDEKIRKSLIHHFKNKTKPYWNEIAVKDIIAYLEKQKEQKPKNILTDDDSLQTAYLKGQTDVLEDPEAYGLQQEQKPAEWRPFDKEVLTKIKELIDSHFSEHEQREVYKDWWDEHISQPAEWSEWEEENVRTRFAFYTNKNDEDDGILYLSNVFVEESSRNLGFGTQILKAAEKVAETIGAISIRLKVKQDSPANAWYRRHGYGYFAFEGDYDWLQKTLEYLKPAKPAEWSEEDEIGLVDALDCVEKARKVAKDEGDMGNCWYAEKWLKSLRPQPHWEPSEEQMDALKQAVAYFGDSWVGKKQRDLESLYSDLKKMK